VAAVNSLYRINSNLKFRYFPLDTSKLSEGFQKSNAQFNRFFQDRQHRIWTFFYNWIFQLDPETKQILRSYHPGEAFIRAFGILKTISGLDAGTIQV
jgi:hypothetical protein